MSIWLKNYHSACYWLSRIWKLWCKCCYFYHFLFEINSVCRLLFDYGGRNIPFIFTFDCKGNRNKSLKISVITESSNYFTIFFGWWSRGSIIHRLSYKNVMKTIRTTYRLEVKLSIKFEKQPFHGTLNFAINYVIHQKSYLPFLTQILAAVDWLIQLN